MGIWIKSQNGHALINATVTWNVDEVINATATTSDRYLTVGVYDSPEEAVRVMDMLSDHVRTAGKTTHPVFQMPPDGFSGKKVFTPVCGGDFCGLIDSGTNAKPGDYCNHYKICKAARDRGVADE